MSDNGNTTITKQTTTKKQKKSNIKRLNFKGRPYNLNTLYEKGRASIHPTSKNTNKVIKHKRQASVGESRDTEQKILSNSDVWRQTVSTRGCRDLGSFYGYQSSYLARRGDNNVSWNGNCNSSVGEERSVEIRVNGDIKDNKKNIRNNTFDTPEKRNKSKNAWGQRREERSPSVVRISEIPMISISASNKRHQSPPVIRRVEVPVNHFIATSPPPIPPSVSVRRISVSPQRTIINNINGRTSIIGSVTNRADSCEKQVLISQIRQLRNSVLKNEKDGKELSLYKQELAVLENEKLRTSLSFNRTMKENEDLFMKLKISEDNNFLMKETIQELDSRLLTADKTIVELENLVQVRSQEKVEIEVEMKHLREKLNTLESLNLTHNSSFNIQNELNIKTQGLRQQINDLITQNNKLRAEKGGYEMRITELETTVSNLDGILTARGIEYEGITTMLSSNKNNLEVVLQENSQLRNQLNFSEERYQKTETDRIDANNKIAELEHVITRLNDEIMKMEVEISILKDQNFQFSNDSKITQEDFNMIRRQFSEIQARHQIDTKRFSDRKLVLEDEIRRLEEHLKKARGQVCEEKRLREESDAQLKALVADLNDSRAKNIDLIKENQNLKNKLEDLNLQIQNCYSIIEELKFKLGDGITNVSDLKDKLSSYLSEITKLKGKLNTANEALEEEKKRNFDLINDYKARIQKLEKENTNLWNQNSSQNREIQDLNINISNLNSQLNNQKKTIENLENRIKELERENKNLKKNVEKLKEKNHDLDTLANELKTQISSFEAIISSLKNEISTLKSDNKLLLSEFDRLKLKIEKLEIEKKKLSEEIEELKQDNQDLKFLNNELEQKVNKILFINDFNCVFFR